MGLMSLSAATDITWERICLTEDMTDPAACDESTPPRWQSSVAVFRFTPGDEYQLYPGRRLYYYKVAATITGYQPQSDEIAGRIDWNGVHPSQITDFEERLASYKPCHGAILQVTVVPSEKSPRSAYPYFMDFEPKQRLLYEQATDTAERASRSLESLNVRKGAGTTDSTEVLDIDQGYSVGVQAQYAGTGGGFNYSHQGQWGTKSMGQQQADNVRTTDSSRESRETVSHSTAITQMYNLFQAYHLGTNRALFYLAPRPHVLEEPSGFIVGPREIDGIQEVFLIVNAPADDPPPCVSIRLDTSHLTTLQQFDYERPAPVLFPPDPMALHVDPPGRDTPDKQRLPRNVGPYYDAYQVSQTRDEAYTTPDGYSIESVGWTVESTHNGSVRYTLDPAGKSLVLSTEAHGLASLRNSQGDGHNTGSIFGDIIVGVLTGGLSVAGGHAGQGIPASRDSDPGDVRAQVRLQLRSDQPTKQVGEQHVLMVTSRGLCCCKDAEVHPSKLIAVRDFDPGVAALGEHQPGKAAFRGLGSPMTARQANALATAIGQVTKRVVSGLAAPQKLPALDADFTIASLLTAASATPYRRLLLAQPLAQSGLLDAKSVDQLAAHLGRPAEAITRLDVLQAPASLLTELTGTDDLHGLRLAALGFPPKPADDDPKTSPEQDKKSSGKDRKDDPGTSPG